MIHGRRNWGRHLARLAACTALGAGVCGLIEAYRWAEPSPAAIRDAMRLPALSTQTMTLLKVDFASYADGHKGWSVRADRIDAERAPGSSLSGLQQAMITGVRSGTLYASPERPERDRIVRTEAISDRSPAGPPAATFTADRGRYAANASDALPSDLRLVYSVYWQFQLMGNVRFKTRQGERLSAPAITILEMHNYRSGRTEQRIVCDQGVDIVSGNVSIHANAIRLDPDTRLVECLGGVRAMRNEKGRYDTAQADSAYWSLHDHTLRCPGTVSGVWDEMNFVSRDMMFNTKTGDFSDPGADLHWTRRRPLKLTLP